VARDVLFEPFVQEMEVGQVSRRECPQKLKLKPDVSRVTGGILEKTFAQEAWFVQS